MNAYNAGGNKAVGKNSKTQYELNGGSAGSNGTNAGSSGRPGKGVKKSTWKSLRSKGSGK